LSATDVEHGCQGGQPAMLWTTMPPRSRARPLRQQTPAPHHVHEGEVDEEQPGRQEEHVCLEGDPVGEGPVMRAGVMMANIIWYAMNTIFRDGALRARARKVTPWRNALSRFPITPPTSPEKHQRVTHGHPITVVQPSTRALDHDRGRFRPTRRRREREPRGHQHTRCCTANKPVFALSRLACAAPSGYGLRAAAPIRAATQVRRSNEGRAVHLVHVAQSPEDRSGHRRTAKALANPQGQGATGNRGHAATISPSSPLRRPPARTAKPGQT